MKKNITAIIIALLLAISMLLTGCNGGDAPGNGDGIGDVGDNGGESGGNEDNGSGESGGESGGNEDNGSGENGGESGGNEDNGSGENGGESGGNEDNGSGENGGESGGNEGENPGEGGENGDTGSTEEEKPGINLQDIPEYSGNAYIVINNNKPFFTSSEITATAFVKYTELDSRGRCGAALASLGKEIMPTDGRENISGFTPSGWTYNGKSNNNTYALLAGQTVYNRTHLLAHQLVSNDADARNLITATPYLNQNTMTSFENMVADYVKETGNHVMYRVTPMFEGDNLIATGVLMEAWSVEDNGDEIEFCVFLYNVQPGIIINYLTGENQLAEAEGDTDINPADSMPKADVGYLLYAESGGKIYYFTSAGSTLATTTDITKAKTVMFEASGTEGYYYVYYLDGGERVYINMTSNSTKTFATSKNKSSVTAWKIDLGKKQIVNKTYSGRAMAFYADAQDIRNYATSQTQIWVWFTEAESE